MNNKWCLFIALVALAALAPLAGAQTDCNIKTCEPCIERNGCQWCGTWSHGTCMAWGTGSCPSRDDEIVRLGESCPPKPEEVLLPVLGIYFALTLVIIGQHLVELQWDRVPYNAWGELDDFSHLHTRDRHTVAQLADETILYADYQRKLGRHKSFLFLLALISGAVVYAIFYQERMGESAWITTAAFVIGTVVLLVQKATAKTALYILTGEQAVIVEPKYMSSCGQKFRFFLPHQMNEVLLRRGERGVGSVWFTTEEDAARHSGELDAARYAADDRDTLHIGFNDILRAEEVWELVARWRANTLGSSPPPDIVEAPDRRVTWADRAQKIVMLIVLAIFCLLFIIISLQSDDNGAYMWYVWVSIPYGIIWGTCGLIYLYARYKEFTHTSRGFVRLTNVPGGPSGGPSTSAALSMGGGFMTLGPGSSSGSEVDVIGVGLTSAARLSDDDSGSDAAGPDSAAAAAATAAAITSPFADFLGSDAESSGSEGEINLL